VLVVLGGGHPGATSTSNRMCSVLAAVDGSRTGVCRFHTVHRSVVVVVVVFDAMHRCIVCIDADATTIRVGSVCMCVCVVGMLVLVVVVM